MALVLILQLLTLWPLCHGDVTPAGSQEAQGPSSPVNSVPPALSLKPSLGARPAAIVTPGVNVTLRCRAPQPAWRFALFKSGEITPVLYRDVSMELAEFFLEDVTPAQGGSYHCCYRNPGWNLGVWSHPSDTLELLVTGEVLGGWGEGTLGAGGGARSQREPALRGPPAGHELRAVPRGRGGAAAVPPLGRALGRLPAARRPRARHLQLLLPHAVLPVRAVAAQRAAGHPRRPRPGLLGLHAGQPPPSGAGRPGAHLSGHTDRF
ncbi:unnamed protein product [Gulo gulo]|uniref:Ig-like domain-containing protein n=1 Tax=Gulo gulo TaxID=48420 RepID=A0A9X9Q9M9_GULGU|nr:unnamed protein product [Gulo gulo]